jgi:hypothetical protein
MSMKLFAHLQAADDLPWRLYVTLARLVVPAFFRGCGIDETEALLPGMKGV